jgi:hypothetical protein
MKAALDWLIRGKDGKVHLAQFPNPPILGWFVFLIASNLANDHALKTGFTSLSVGFLAIWAYLEIIQGSSRIRQILGLVVGAVLIYSCF